jgi:hypothetical protein
MKKKITEQEKGIIKEEVKEQLFLIDKLNEHLTKKTILRIIMNDGTNYFGKIVDISKELITMQNDARPSTLMQFNFKEIRIIGLPREAQ